jgi:hypothetical protein
VICHRAKRARVAFNVWAVGLALVAAATPLLGTLHLASVAHFTCAEDGELVESPFVDHTGDVEHEDGPNGVVLPERHETDRDAAQGHDHCTLALHARSGSRATAAARAVFDCARSGEQLRSTAPQLAQLRAQAVYRLAPKASPPRAA